MKLLLDWENFLKEGKEAFVSDLKKPKDAYTNGNFLDVAKNILFIEL